MKNVIINVKSVQEQDGDNEEMELTAMGKLAYNDGKWRLIYAESDDAGMGGVTTTISADGEMITLSRTGNVESQLVVENGQRHMCQYDTVNGYMVVGVFGEKMKYDIGRAGGELSMSYTIDINSAYRSRNHVTITVKEAGTNHVHLS